MQSCSSVSLGSDSLLLGLHPKCLTQKGLSLGIRAQAVSVSCLLYRVSATYRKASPDPLMQKEPQRSDRGPAEGSLIGRWAFNFKMEVSMKILPLEIPFFCMVSCSASLCFCWVSLVASNWDHLWLSWCLPPAGTETPARPSSLLTETLNFSCQCFPYQLGLT